MGSPVVAPPPQPPDVSGQMGGGNPFSGMGDLLQKRMASDGGGDQAGAAAGAPPGGHNPMGAMTAQRDALEKVLKQMATQLPGFGPYADRALKIINMGLQEAGKSAAGGQPQPESGGAPSMASPLPKEGTY